jgi:hypothetical protein
MFVRKRNKNTRIFKRRYARDLVRDEGVAGSNPATPTNLSLIPNGFPDGARSMTRILVALCALTLAGCGGAAKVSAPKIDPRAEYQNALDAYQACINSNLNNAEACEEKRVQMETNERAYLGR